MKISNKLLILFLLVYLTAGSCTGKKTEPLVPVDYAGWDSTVLAPLTMMIPGHTGPLRKIYINDVGKKVKIATEDGSKRYDYPEGTIIVKEVFPDAAGEQTPSLTVMIKDPSHPQAWGGWVWIFKNSETGDERIFSDEFCFVCHQNANEQHPYGDKNIEEEFRDYVYFPYTE